MEQVPGDLALVEVSQLLVGVLEVNPRFLYNWTEPSQIVRDLLNLLHPYC